jgi:hypothetical protein
MQLLSLIKISPKVDFDESLKLHFDLGLKVRLSSASCKLASCASANLPPSLLSDQRAQV